MTEPKSMRRTHAIKNVLALNWLLVACSGCYHSTPRAVWLDPLSMWRSTAAAPQPVCQESSISPAPEIDIVPTTPLPPTPVEITKVDPTDDLGSGAPIVQASATESHVLPAAPVAPTEIASAPIETATALTGLGCSNNGCGAGTCANGACASCAPMATWCPRQWRPRA